MAWTVYELTNPGRREIVVVSTGANLVDELRRNRTAPPPPIANWSAESRRTLIVLDVYQDEHAALERLRRRLTDGAPRGWRIDVHAPSSQTGH